MIQFISSLDTLLSLDKSPLRSRVSAKADRDRGRSGVSRSGIRTRARSRLGQANIFGTSRTSGYPPPFALQKIDCTMVSALNACLSEVLDGVPMAILFGEDIEDPKGGVFGFTKGLSTRHPGRVINSRSLALRLGWLRQVIDQYSNCNLLTSPHRDSINSFIKSPRCAGVQTVIGRVLSFSTLHVVHLFQPEAHGIVNPMRRFRRIPGLRAVPQHTRRSSRIIVDIVAKTIRPLLPKTHHARATRWLAISGGWLWAGACRPSRALMPRLAGAIVSIGARCSRAIGCGVLRGND